MAAEPLCMNPSSAPSNPDARRGSHAAEMGDWLWSQGQFGPAVQSYMEAVRLEPEHAEYHLKLASAARLAEEAAPMRGDRDLIEPHLLQAIRLDPRSAAAHQALSLWYEKTGRFDAALRHNQIALELQGQDRSVLVSRASILLACGRTSESWEIIQEAVAGGALDAGLVCLYARLAPRFARAEDALALIDRALRCPDIANDAAARMSLHYAAALLLDAMQRYDEAFGRARLANETARLLRPPYDPALHSRRISAKIEHFSAPRLRSLSRAAHGNARAVFIVGMPRSGTSLVEQVLASHPQVHGAGELETLGRTGLALGSADCSRDDRYPQFLESASAAQLDELARPYLAVLDRQAPRARYVTDKMPHNFLNLELAEILLPGCRVIHCVRDALDTCLSCYMTNFAVGNEFKHVLPHLGAYYRDYCRLMAHWQQVLTIPILDVRYEELVQDTESHVRRLLQFLELPWDDRCLTPHLTDRPTMTASQDQVRRPIYQSAISRWKHYERHLGALKVALGGFPNDQ